VEPRLSYFLLATVPSTNLVHLYEIVADGSGRVHIFYIQCNSQPPLKDTNIGFVLYHYMQTESLEDWVVTLSVIPPNILCPTRRWVNFLAVTASANNRTIHVVHASQHGFDGASMDLVLFNLSYHSFYDDVTKQGGYNMEQKAASVICI
jgi:hypothetical protein